MSRQKQATKPKSIGWDSQHAQAMEMINTGLISRILLSDEYT